MSEPFDRKKQRLGALYGLVGGVAFSLAAWGYDALVLANSHILYPLIKLLPGLVICALVGSLVGWVSIKIGKTLVTILVWAAFTVFLVWLIIWIPFKLTPLIIKVLKPSLVEWVDYPLVANVEQFRILGLVVFTAPAIICGLLQTNIIEGILMSSHRGAFLAIILVCGLLMGLAGLAGDEMTSRHFREPAVALDTLFDFAIENQGKQVDEKLARRMHLSTVRDLADILQYKRQMMLIAFDNTLGQMDYLVNFEGIWVKCSTIYSQPVFCEQVLKAPAKYFYSPVNRVPVKIN